MLLTADQQSAIGHEQDDANFKCFFRLLKDGEMFHCTSHQKESLSRNDTFKKMVKFLLAK